MTVAPTTDRPAGVASIAEAIAHMEGIAAALPAADGLSCFNRMYLQVTQLVADRLAAGEFADAQFMNVLDVTFANRYLATADAAGDGSAPVPPGVPRCWAALLENRRSDRIDPVQFALAGMNAHINHDLPLALVDTCGQLGTSPEQGTHHADYDRINAVLGAVEEQVRQSFEAGIVRAVDQQLSPLETVVANWSITAARDAAWTNSQAIWALRHLPGLRADYVDGLDRLVGLAGRGLLVPTR
ncbi:MAG: DUF5995 family protein [Actinomycetota bacterium]|nr:DUF5995 family protein [Actinomycetota bacterium]